MDRSTEPGASRADILRRADRPEHPLKAWRLTRRVWDVAKRGWRSMTRAEASRALGVPYTTWDAWEKYADEPGHRRPSDDNLERLFVMTEGAIRPDHFYPIEAWRRRRDASKSAADEAAEQGRQAAGTAPPAGKLEAAAGG